MTYGISCNAYGDFLCRQTNDKNFMKGKGKQMMEVIATEKCQEKSGACVPISEKYLLTIREASAYFNLGIKRLRRLAEENTDSFSIYNGSRCMIIRPKFEKFLDESSSI